MRMKWVGYMAHYRQKRNAYRAERDYLEELGIPWRIIIKQILNMLVRHRLD
jgi:hypothetical protein